MWEQSLSRTINQIVEIFQFGPKWWTSQATDLPAWPKWTERDWLEWWWNSILCCSDQEKKEIYSSRAVLWECLRVGHKYSLLAVTVGCYGNEAKGAFFLFFWWSSFVAFTKTVTGNVIVFLWFLDYNLQRFHNHTNWPQGEYRHNCSNRGRFYHTRIEYGIFSFFVFFFSECYDADSDSIAHMISVWSRTLAGELCRKASGSLESSDGRRSWGGIGHLWDEQQKGRENKSGYEWENTSETHALVRWVWC